MSENSLFGRVTAAAEERQLLQNTLTAYRRPNAIAVATTGCLALETLLCDMSRWLYSFLSRRPRISSRAALSGLEMARFKRSGSSVNVRLRAMPTSSKVYFPAFGRAAITVS